MPRESFGETALEWLAWAQARSRKPIRKATAHNAKFVISKWLIPHLGSLPLEKVNNGSVKKMVQAMKAEGLSPKTMTTHVTLVKTIMKSVMDEETGEPLHPRTWNSTFLDLPVIANQKQPCYTREEIEELITRFPSNTWERMLVILLAATGLRVSEALGLDVMSCIGNGYRTLTIQAQGNQWGKRVEVLKTDAGRREVDLPEDVAILLKRYCIMGRSMGQGQLLFGTRNRTCKTPRNIRRYFRLTKGFHGFRRFRQTHLSKMNCNHDVNLFWMGHKPQDMSGLYSKLKDEVETRLEEANRVGTGFELPAHQGVKAA